MARTFAARHRRRARGELRVPVINGLSDLQHPCQSLADLQTVLEHRRSLRGAALRATSATATTSPHSLLVAAGRLRPRASAWPAPPATSPRPRSSAQARASAGRRLRARRHARPRRGGATGRDVVYTDVWASMGQEAEAERRRASSRPTSVNARAGGAPARREVLVLHCLPAHRGEEITAEVHGRPALRRLRRGREPAARAEGAAAPAPSPRRESPRPAAADRRLGGVVSETAADLRETPLTALHRDLGAKLVPFAGFRMPVQYASITAEHHAVRQRAGLFDISHMGEFHVSGAGATAFLDRMTVNDVSGLAVHQAHYSASAAPTEGSSTTSLLYRSGRRLSHGGERRERREGLELADGTRARGRRPRGPLRQRPRCSPCRGRGRAEILAPLASVDVTPSATTGWRTVRWRASRGADLADRLHRRGRVRALRAPGRRGAALERAARGGRGAGSRSGGARRARLAAPGDEATRSMATTSTRARTRWRPAWAGSCGWTGATSSGARPWPACGLRARAGGWWASSARARLPAAPLSDPAGRRVHGRGGSERDRLADPRPGDRHGLLARGGGPERNAIRGGDSRDARRRRGRAHAVLSGRISEDVTQDPHRSAAVLTVSDRCARGEATDESGPHLVTRLREARLSSRGSAPWCPTSPHGSRAPCWSSPMAGTWR